MSSLLPSGEHVVMMIMVGSCGSLCSWGNVAMRSAGCDGTRSISIIPAPRTKNHREPTIPLPPPALALIKASPRRSDFVFGEGAVRGYSGWSKSKIALDARVTLPPWRLHDLRRTAATGLANLGVLPHVIEAVLNHVSGHKAGVAGVYNRARRG
jgi:integrase